MGKCDAVLLYTDAEAAVWRPLLPASVKVIGAQNALDQTETQTAIREWTDTRLLEFRRAHALEGRKVLLFCGRLRQATGVDTLLRALQRLRASDPTYLAVIIGDGEERAGLHSLAAELGVSSDVRWLGSQYQESLNSPWFLCAQVFAYPGSIGLSILHAMGYGLPVVTHADRRRHNPEIAALRDGWNGLEFHPADAADLAEKLQRICCDPPLRQAMSERARQTVDTSFSIENMSDRFCEAVDYALFSSQQRRACA